GVEPRERALEPETPAIEDGVVHDLVQQHREVEDRESLDERQRNPDERVRAGDEPPRCERQDEELAARDYQVPRGALLVQRLQLGSCERRGELGAKRGGVSTVEVALQGLTPIVLGGWEKGVGSSSTPCALRPTPYALERQ